MKTRLRIWLLVVTIIWVIGAGVFWATRSVGDPYAGEWRRWDGYGLKMGSHGAVEISRVGAPPITGTWRAEEGWWGRVSIHQSSYLGSYTLAEVESSTELQSRIKAGSFTRCRFYRLKLADGKSMDLLPQDGALFEIEHFGSAWTRPIPWPAWAWKALQAQLRGEPAPPRNQPEPVSPIRPVARVSQPVGHGLGSLSLIHNYATADRSTRHHRKARGPGVRGSHEVARYP